MTAAGPKQHVACPYLGTLEDNTTCFRFPSTHNRCWRIKPVGEVAALYQSAHCLTVNHQLCAVFISGQPVSGVLVGKRSRAARASPLFNWRIWLVGLEVLALLAVSIFFASDAVFGFTQPMAAQPNPTRTPLPTQIVLQNPTALPVVDSAATLTAIPTLALPATPTASATPSPIFTQAPEPGQPVGPLNLVAHPVQTGDTIASLAAQYLTTIDVVIKVNGLEKDRSIRPGQVLVMPLGASAELSVPHLVAFKTVQETPLTIIVQQLGVNMDTVRTLNDLGPSDIVPAGRWLFMPQP